VLVIFSDQRYQNKEISVIVLDQVLVILVIKCLLFLVLVIFSDLCHCAR
jgi:hypothetical protein